MNVQCNKYNPFLEAETDTLRVSIIHESVTNTGYSVSIRKTPPERRLNYNKIISEEYCTDKLDAFMSNAVKAGCNIIACGLPGTGKTEYIKYLTQFIAPHEKVITIEDNLEIRYRAINPGKDCVEVKVGDTMSYSEAIKLSMRQLPKWLMLSEARSKEVVELLSSLSTGAHCLTTLHTDDVRKVAERIRNMSRDVNVNDIYMFLDLAVLIKSEVKTGEKIKRKIAQVGIIDHSMETGENKIILLYEDGKFLLDELPEDLMKKFKNEHILEPFQRENNN
jgi:pilus assembly protein CpaF